MNNPYLLLKWGSIKGWGNLTQAQVDALQKQQDIGVSISAMTQKNTDKQKQLLCDAFDLFEDGQISNDSGAEYAGFVGQSIRKAWSRKDAK